MRRPIRIAALTGAASALLLGAAVVTVSTGSATAAPAPSQFLASTRAVGLSTDGTRVATFQTLDPRRVGTPRLIVGLAGDTKLIGIDQRVANGLLYGVGDQGGIYTLDGRVATKVGTLSVPLQGSAFGVDFNPAADRLRIISDTGQSLRHNLGDGVTAVDTGPNYVAGTPVQGINASAYTNNDNSANTATTLYNIDANLDQLVMQVPANSGTLVAVGKLGIDLTVASGFDIDTSLKDGQADRHTAYVVGSGPGTPNSLFTIDLLTGKLSQVGRLPGISDIAVVLG